MAGVPGRGVQRLAGREQRRGLLRAERLRRAGEKFLTLIRVASDGRGSRHDQPGFDHRIQSRVRGAAFLQQAGDLHRGADPGQAERLDEFGLARRLFFQGEDFLVRRRPQEPGEELFFVIHRRVPDHLRQHAAHRRFHGAAIVIRHPAG